ncbi:hypothetical protein [Nocardia sp. NPDC056564]
MTGSGVFTPGCPGVVTPGWLGGCCGLVGPGVAVPGLGGASGFTTPG